MISLASFWAGPNLSGFEKACLRSVALRGYEVYLYSYDKIVDLPEGVVLLPAADLAPIEFLQRFRHGNRPDMAHFSDYFRYLIFLKTPHIWIDADVLLLSRFDAIVDKDLIVNESSKVISNAVMRLDSSHPKLEQLIDAAENLMDRELTWGQTGPDLMEKVFGREDRIFANIQPCETFFPIQHQIFWKMLLPEHREECEALSARSYGVHLFNNIIDKAGLWKNLAPPDGSYLASKFAIDGTLSLFVAQYPANIIRKIIENWRLSLSGSNVTFTTLSKRIVPAFVKSAENLYRRKIAS